MPRVAQTDIEDDVFAKLEVAKGEITYPATLKTLVAVRSSVYKYNRENSRNFRIAMLDDGVRISEKPEKSPYEKALDEIKGEFKSASQTGENAAYLIQQATEIINKYFKEKPIAITRRPTPKRR